MTDFLDQEPEDRKAFIDRELGRLKPTPKSETKPAPKIETVFPDDFLFADGHWPISKALAAQMHWTVGDEARGKAGSDD